MLDWCFLLVGFQLQNNQLQWGLLCSRGHLAGRSRWVHAGTVSWHWCLCFRRWAGSWRTWSTLSERTPVASSSPWRRGRRIPWPLLLPCSRMLAGNLWLYRYLHTPPPPLLPPASHEHLLHVSRPISFSFIPPARRTSDDLLCRKCFVLKWPTCFAFSHFVSLHILGVSWSSSADEPPSMVQQLHPLISWLSRWDAKGPSWMGASQRPASHCAWETSAPQIFFICMRDSVNYSTIIQSVIRSETKANHSWPRLIVTFDR